MGDDFEALPVEISIGDKTESHFIESMKIRQIRGERHPITLRLDNGEIDVSRELAEPIYQQLKEQDND